MDELEEARVISEEFVKKAQVDMMVQTELTEQLAQEVLAASSKDAGPPDVDDLPRATTRCGWRFSASGASLLSASALPESHKALCARCFPSERAAAKESLAAAARKLGALGASAAGDPPNRIH